MTAKKKTVIGYVLASLAIIAADQALKAWVVRNIPLNASAAQQRAPAAAIAKLPYQILQALVGAALGMVLRWKVKPLAKLAGKLGETVG